MCHLSSILRDKPRWWLKIKDETIAAAWRKEAIDQGLEAKQADYVLAELEDYAQMRDEKFGVEVKNNPRPSRPAFGSFSLHVSLPQVSCFDGVWQSDTLISEEIRDALREAVRKLEDVPEANKDWHPNSDDLVLDLVHPSLYPLVYRLTIVAPNLEPIEASRGNDVTFSDKFA